MRDSDKLECIHRRAMGTVKGHKAAGYKEQLMTPILFMLEETHGEHEHGHQTAEKLSYKREAGLILHHTWSPKTC